jgi:uncharacterized cupredoxin-like copper-binding protein
MRYIILRRAALGIIAILAVMLLVGACGSASGQSNSSPTEVQVALSEFKIDSSQTTFTTGTPYRFVIKNEGTVPHNWAIMPRGETDESQALISVGADQLPPGATVTRDYTFTQTGDWEFACHLPGHYEAGMFLHITVQ